MSIFNKIKKSALTQPRKTALIIGDKKLTYKELVLEVESVSRYFDKLKIKPNDRVGLVENNTLEFILIFLATSNIGAQIVPLNTNYTHKMIYENFLDLKIKHLFIWHNYLKYPNFKKMALKNIVTLGKKIKSFHFFNEYNNQKNKIYNIKNIPSFLNNDFVITLTSGSTSKPKPIVLTQKIKINRSLAAKKIYNINNNDIILTASPLDHSLGQRLLLLPLLSGGTSVVLSTFTIFNFYESIKNNKITFTILVSSQISELEKSKLEFKRLYLKKGLVSASSKLNNNLKKKLIKKNVKIFEMYGASEVGTVTNILFNKKNNKYKSVGKACSGAKIKILSEKNKFLPHNNIGEIVCSTPLKFKKYFGLKKETKNSFFKKYFKTGDIGYLDKDNYLYYVGRKKNIMKISGINVFPEDIEKILILNKTILDVAVLGIINQSGKEQIVACIIIKNERIKKETLFDYCYKNLATFQYPSQILILKSFPRTVLGKVNKIVLKKIVEKKL